MKQASIGWSLIRIYTFLVYVFLFAPIVVVIVLAFNPKQFGIFPMEGVSLRWFIKLAQNESIIEAFQNSLVLGSLTAVISTGIGILAAWRSSASSSPARTPSTPCCCRRS
jgi:spermidine/putrescine transport system permease protein